MDMPWEVRLLLIAMALVPAAIGLWTGLVPYLRLRRMRQLKSRPA